MALLWQIVKAVLRNPADATRLTLMCAVPRTGRTPDAGIGLTPPTLEQGLGQPAHICTWTGLSAHIGAETGPAPRTSAPGTGLVTLLTPADSCTGTGLAPAISAPGLGSIRPHLHRDWAQPHPHLHSDWARPCHICTGTGLNTPTSALGPGPAPSTSARGRGSPSPTSAPGLCGSYASSTPDDVLLYAELCGLATAHPAQFKLIFTVCTPVPLSLSRYPQLHRPAPASTTACLAVANRGCPARPVGRLLSTPRRGPRVHQVHADATGRGGPSPGADVGGVGPVPVQMWT
jgi:hypothetical protein